MLTNCITLILYGIIFKKYTKPDKLNLKFKNFYAAASPRTILAKILYALAVSRKNASSFEDFSKASLRCRHPERRALASTCEGSPCRPS